MRFFRVESKVMRDMKVMIPTPYIHTRAPALFAIWKPLFLVVYIYG
jgi:hypothetical protein